MNKYATTSILVVIMLAVAAGLVWQYCAWRYFGEVEIPDTGLGDGSVSDSSRPIHVHSKPIDAEEPLYKQMVEYALLPESRGGELVSPASLLSTDLDFEGLSFRFYDDKVVVVSASECRVRTCTTADRVIVNELRRFAAGSEFKLDRDELSP